MSVSCHHDVIDDITTDALTISRGHKILKIVVILVRYKRKYIFRVQSVLRNDSSLIHTDIVTGVRSSGGGPQKSRFPVDITGGRDPILFQRQILLRFDKCEAKDFVLVFIEKDQISILKYR